MRNTDQQIFSIKVLIKLLFILLIIDAALGICGQLTTRTTRLDVHVGCISAISPAPTAGESEDGADEDFAPEFEPETFAARSARKF